MQIGNSNVLLNTDDAESKQTKMKTMLSKLLLNVKNNNDNNIDEYHKDK